MFKEEFNELAVAIERFVLDEKQRPKFESVSEEVLYYRNIVDEYMAIESNISNIIDSIDQEKFINLFEEMTNELALLNTAFEKYKTEFIVISYIDELENFDNQSMLYERIYKFEKSLVIEPLIKVDIETIQEVLVYVKEYANNTDKFYFFANNPFEIDEKFNIVIPKRFEYDNASEFVNAVYNYLLGLLHTYKSINADELVQMESLELLLKEKLYEFSDILRNANKNKYQESYGTTPNEYYNAVTEILDTLQTYSDSLIEAGIYRFNVLKNEFKILEKNHTQLKEYYYSNELFKSWEMATLFDNKLLELQDIINLLEDGKINIDKKYVIDDSSIKTLVDEIVLLAREEKKRIFYTEKYNTSGIPTVMTFEFYQTDAFIQSIKKYYYELMTQNIYRYSNISIDEYGDDTVNEYRAMYKLDYAKYNQFIAQDVYFMDEFEISEYILKIKDMQRLLKKTAELFFNAAIQTSPLTYQETIENHYKIFLDKLVSDLETIELKKIDTIMLNVDTNRTEALKNLREIEKHVTLLEQIIVLSRRYVFLGMTDFINENIFTTYNYFYKKTKESFDKEEYIKVISDYKQFYKSSIFDFNMLNSLEKLAKSVETIFTEISSANAIFIDEQISGVPVHKENSSVSFMNDLFNDETYKVLRNEIFSQLDNFYQYVTSSRENEKTFLINEKNLKKAYFDNQLIKLNYMRIYDTIIRIGSSIENFDENILMQYKWYNDEKEYLNSFNYIGKLDSLILNQNRVLSELSKMITEYTIDNGILVDITENSISAIEEYITLTQNDIQKYEQTLEKIVAMHEYEKLIERKKELIKEHTESWVTLINDNQIKSPEKISYNEMETFEGSVPFLAEFKAKTETTEAGGVDLGEATFLWDFGDHIEYGAEVSYTFYKEGIHQVRCEMTFESGETSTRFIEFNISGPTNSQIVKSATITYTPIRELINQPKFTYFNVEEGKQMTIPINIDGNLIDMLSDGNIVVSAKDEKLIKDNIGLVVLGFNGVGFPGSKFEISQIFDEGFELPEEAEFLFDFSVSDPIINKSVLSISNSKFVEYMAKVPKERARSVYQVENVDEFTPSVNETMDIIEGDLFIMKNKMGRYAIISVDSIKEVIEVEAESFYFEIVFTVNVNISMNQFEQKTFKPQSAGIVVPTLIFKTNVKELFSTMITRLESINLLREELKAANDSESKLTIANKIEDLEQENRKFYLFEEYNRLEAKINSFENMLKQIDIDLIDYESLSSEDIKLKNLELQYNLDDTKTFEDYMNTINVYEFRKNVIDLTVLLDLYKEQKDVMGIIIDTYDFKKYNITYYEERIQKLKYIGNSVSIDTTKDYIGQIIDIVGIMRTYLFKIKLIINFPIMTDGKYIIFNSIFERLFKDESSMEYYIGAERDLYLMNKKLELRYGYEIDKVEAGLMYGNIIEETTSLLKSTFGSGLSVEETINLSNYIQVVEDRVVEEYDDFFMISFWIDYLEKLN